MRPTFLTLSGVVAIHADQVARYGGSPAIRDLALLQSAVAMPAAGVRDRYLHNDLYEMAAAYLYHIVRDHPFVDGNKRTGLAAASVFLALNGVLLDAEDQTLESLVRLVAQGKATKAEVTTVLRSRSSDGANA